MLTALCAVLGHARRGEALSCALPTEHYTLTIVSVTVDGSPASDLGPWQRHAITMTSTYNGVASVRGYRADEADFYLSLEPQP